MINIILSFYIPREMYRDLLLGKTNMRSYMSGQHGHTFSRAPRFLNGSQSPKTRRVNRYTSGGGEFKSKKNRTQSDTKPTTLPGNPKEDISGRFDWQIVDIKCGANPSKGFSLTGKSHEIGANMLWARKEKPVKTEPGCPKEDVNNKYEWCAVCIQTAGIIRAPKEFCLTGTLIENGQHMWARKLLNSNPQ